MEVMVNCDQGGWWMPATLKNVFQMIVDRYIIGDLRSNRLCFAWVRDKRGFLWEVKVERPRVELPASAAPVSAAPVSAVSSAASISGRRIGESYYHVSVVRCYRKHAAGFEDIDTGTAETMTVHPWAGVGRAMVALPPCAHTATDNYFFLEFFVGRSMWLQDSFAGRVRHFLHRRRARAAVGGGARAMQRKPEQNGDRV